MSIGSKIYKRFGLKFALAYRIRKTKRKILRKTFVQKPLMLYFLFNLQRDFKAFRIYRTLRQQNILIANPKNLKFILQHYKLILQWLNSKEFKEQYITTNHPYPPLLNPKRLNAKRDKEKNNNNKETEWIKKEGELKECGANLQSKEAESKEIESQDIQPYPNLSYESISPELAWDLNLPLPPYYGFVWFGGHGVGMVALHRFFTQACNLKVDLRWDKNSKITYINRYNFLKNNQNEVYKTFNISDVRKEKDFTKYLCLVSQPKAILWSVRCPIGLLKHALGVDWGNRWWRKNKEVQQTFNLTYSWNKYIEWLRYNKPTINPNFESMKSLLF